MFSLRSRQDKFRIQFPKEFIPSEIEEKYSKILREKHSFFISPIEFLNETIQKIEVLGFNDATVAQQQPRHGDYNNSSNSNKININRFMYPASDTVYRASTNPESLLDKTLNITFKHTLGFLNYFLIFECFLYHYKRQTKYKEIIKELPIDLFDNKGAVYSRIILQGPIINSMDMLSLDYSQPTAQSQTFMVIFKYSDFDYQFIEADSSNWNGEVE